MQEVMTSMDLIAAALNLIAAALNLIFWFALAVWFIFGSVTRARRQGQVYQDWRVRHDRSPMNAAVDTGIVKDEYQRRWRRYLATAAILIPAMLVYIHEMRPEDSFSPTASGLGAALVALAASLFCLWDWRCPACKVYLRGAIHPRCCPRCEIQLRG
jgi:hypothetical protein